ncbi:hypothetical protein AALP_AA1G296000 [Arabis alpina]|uniref:Uncharacterized protein n=1 Tax=Arabis alpina TaxID=50452 RepID=A0A087HRI2_ARAAL|nr:hypothetical protein AALP_AA1G296000 [Arabis alpina]
MSCKGEVVVGVEEGLFLLPSNLFNEIFLDCIVPFQQSYRGGSYYDRKQRAWYALSHYGSMDKPSDVGAERKARGTGVFLPQRPVSSTQEKLPKKKPCTIISSNSKQIFLPKEWAY